MTKNFNRTASKSQGRKLLLETTTEISRQQTEEHQNFSYIGNFKDINVGKSNIEKNRLM